MTTTLAVHVQHVLHIGASPQVIGIAAMPATATDLRREGIEITGIAMPEAIGEPMHGAHPLDQGPDVDHPIAGAVARATEQPASGLEVESGAGLQAVFRSLKAGRCRGIHHHAALKSA
jgi:hypothetical protein